MRTGHWDAVWQSRLPEDVSWFQTEPTVSLRMIRAVSTPDDGVIDIGGGASRLVDRLLTDGYRDLTVLDIAAPAISAAQRRLGRDHVNVTWIVADATHCTFDRTFGLWHDRAVFHFLTDAEDRDRYLSTMSNTLAAGGHVVLSTFGPDGPETCSGLPVRRYTTELMSETLGAGYELIDHEFEQHATPGGGIQQFLYGLFRRVR